MHNDILEAKIEAAKRRRDTGVDMGRCLSLLAMLDDRKTENLQRVARHEEDEISLKNRIQVNEANNLIRGVDKAIDIHGRDQLAKCVSKQNELLAQVELIEEIEKFMKGD